MSHVRLSYVNKVLTYLLTYFYAPNVKSVKS